MSKKNSRFLGSEFSFFSFIFFKNKKIIHPKQGDNQGNVAVIDIKQLSYTGGERETNFKKSNKLGREKQ